MRFKNGLGGARSIEKARLYLALEPGKCTIRKAKIFLQKDRNPNGLSIAFKIVVGARFVTDAAGWRREEEAEENAGNHVSHNVPAERRELCGRPFRAGCYATCCILLAKSRPEVGGGNGLSSIV